jgi:hypothetical protein
MKKTVAGLKSAIEYSQQRLKNAEEGMKEEKEAQQRILDKLRHLP